MLTQGRVKKTLADRQAWWGIAAANLAKTHSAKVITPIEPAPAASAPEKPPVPKPVPQATSGVPKSDKPAITATEFVVSFLANSLGREWRIAEIVQAGGQKWTEPNVYKSLARLFANGQVNKTIKGTTAWWSAAATATATPAKIAAPAKVRVTAAPSLRVVKAAAVEEPATAPKASVPPRPSPAPTPAASATKPAPTCATAAAFIVKLLRRVAKKLVTRVTNAKKAASRSRKG